MKSKTLKKFSAIFLSAIMVLTMMPVMAFAEETATEDVVVEDVVDEGVVEEDIVIEEDSETPEIVNPAVNYTDVAPFLEPVEGVAPRMMRMMTLAAQAEDENDNGLVLNKSVSEPDANGQYTLTLEAYATGAKTIIEGKKDVPTDIVLVLDQSGSMDNDFGGYNAVYTLDTSKTYYVYRYGSYTEVFHYNGKWYSSGEMGGYTEVTPKTSEDDSNGTHTQFYEGPTSALEALKDAVRSFASAVENKAKGPNGILGDNDDINHTISVVGFANYSNYDNYNNTEVFVGNTGYKYNDGAADKYAEAPQDMSTAEGVANVNASINALTASGATYVDLGIEMANGILAEKSVPAGETRNRVVIVFTDGVPGYYGEYGGDSYGSQGNNAQAVADAAMEQIAITKNTHKATVYTVGIFNGADASKDGDSSGSDTERANYFMHRLSSNTTYPQTPSYYLSAGDASALNNIFQQISNNIESGGSSVTLDENTVVKDVITEQFVLPQNAKPSDIKVYTADADPNAESLNFKDRVSFTDAQVSIGSDDRTISVTNFNFADNWVGTETINDNAKYRGKKLIIEIPILVRDGFLGGNNVLTNGSGSGVYASDESEEAVEEFVSPDVDVEIEPVSVTAESFNVYLYGGITEENIKNGATVKCGDVVIDLDAENYGLKSWQNAYVNIEQPVGGSLSNLTDDTSYTLTCTVEPKEAGTVKKQSNNAVGKINVFKPVITFEDDTVYYGENEPSTELYNENNYVDVVWKHGETVAPESMGTAPQLQYEYTPINGVVNEKIATKEDVPVKVTVKIGDTIIGDTIENKYTTFLHKECTEGEQLPSDSGFVLHVKTCTLTIKKTGGTEGEPYIFNITKDGEAYTSATIVGNGSATITELPVGKYEVAEDTSWAWRYNPTWGEDRNTAELKKGNVSDTISCTNQLEQDKWLDSFSSVITNVFGIGRLAEGGTDNE